MTQKDRITALFLMVEILKQLDEVEQNAFMCASIEALAETRKMTPFDLIEQYVEAIVEVNLNENKRK